jgi:hypothetical protein
MPTSINSPTIDRLNCRDDLEVLAHALANVVTTGLISGDFAEAVLSFVISRWVDLRISQIRDHGPDVCAMLRRGSQAQTAVIP